MFKTQEFIDKCDVLLNAGEECEKLFKTYLKEYLLTKDYDALVTLYGLYLNREIRIRICEYRRQHNVEALPEHLSSREGIKLCNEVREWQKCKKDELLNLADQAIGVIRDFYQEQHKEMPEGIIECLTYTGHSWIYSAMMTHEAFERDWDVISTMFALAYEPHIQIQMIRSEFVNDYKAANRFIRENKIYLPYYYVAVWDIWKTGVNYKDKRYEYNRSRLKQIVRGLPGFYRELLSGSYFYPTKERVRTIASGIGENGEVVPIVTQLAEVPFYRYLPTFVRNKPAFENDRNGLRNEFFHPRQMLEVPCTNLFTRLDVELYLNNLYKEIEMERLQKRIIDYEPQNFMYSDSKGDRKAKACKRVSKKVNGMLDLTESKKREIIARLENRLSKTAELVYTFEKGKKPNEVVKKLEDAGYARKTYYDIKSLSGGQAGKSVPAKDTLIAVACALELTIEQTKKLLYSSGYIFSPAVERDVVIEYFLEKGMHNIVHINLFLDYLGLKPIEGKKRKK